jgi:hypothetical protein
MSDYHDDLLRRLERATKNGQAALEQLPDKEEAELREAWGGLTRLLRAAEEPFAADGLLENLEHATGRAGARWTRVVWRAGGLAALAACLALMVVWATGRSTVLRNGSRSVPERPVNQAALVARPAWNDSVDEQLFDLQQQIRAVYWSQRDVPENASYLSDNLDAFGNELRDSEL